MCIIFALRNCSGFDVNLNIKAFYDPLSNTVCIFLPLIKSSNDDYLIKEIVDVINHESLHHVFKEVLGIQSRARVDMEHKVMEILGIE